MVERDKMNNLFPDNPDALARRRLLWIALSKLCLDTEIDKAAINYIACTIHEQGFSLEEAEYIAFHEVIPPLYINFFSVAGVWDGFDPAWLETRITEWRKSGWRRFLTSWMQGRYRKFLQDEWQRVEESFRSGQFLVPELPPD